MGRAAGPGGPGEKGQAPPALAEGLRRAFGRELGPQEAVALILEEVRREGDEALRRYNALLDGWDGDLEVPPQEMEKALAELEPGLCRALEAAAGRVRFFHEEQLRHGPSSFVNGGLGQVVRPLERVGLYIPGTVAIYPSSVLMTAIPARVAGVEEVLVASPPGPQGLVSPVKLAAAAIAGVDRVFRLGGAQAVAAFAFGTASVPRVDKVCGPGGLMVTLAKAQVYGAVGVDGLFGPSETIVIADDSADPALCAADLLAQAEHDELSMPVLITTAPEVAEAVAEEVEKQLALLERGEIAATAWQAQGGIAIVGGLEEAVALANEFAPEHLCLMVRDVASVLAQVKNAGGVFVGWACPEALGDYILGPSHVMPTEGSARFASPLTVYDFLKVTAIAGTGEEELRELGPLAAAIARAEGLTAHARAIEMRLEHQR